MDGYRDGMRMRTLVGPLLVAGLAAMARRLARPASGQPWHDVVRPPDPDPVPPVDVRAVRTGSMTDRGAAGTVAIDLHRARAQRVEPVVEFLTYVQARRGDRSHLMFVRRDDLDAMALAADEPLDGFLARLDQLGVVVSHN